MRELTLDDAIQKFEKKALQWDGVIADSSQQKEYSRKKAENYRQLAEWLKDYKRLLKAEEDIKFWINSNNRGNCDYFIVDKIEEVLSNG